MATQGDTVYLVCVFADEDDNPTDPEAGSVKINTYDQQQKLVDGPLAVSEAQYRTAVGTFKYPYVVPIGKNPLIWEYSGMVNGHIELRRASLPTAFVE